MGKACPIPVIEAKKALAEGAGGVLVKVDNKAAVQNLEKMASGLGYDFSYTENSKSSFEVIIGRQGDAGAAAQHEGNEISRTPAASGTSVMIGTKSMGKGSEELGEILIKGFIYSLTELPIPPEHVIFFNSGAFLTAAGANTIDDLKKLAAKGTKIMTCGTCVNFYGLPEKPAVGEVVNMYEITETISAAAKVLSI